MWVSKTKIRQEFNKHYMEKFNLGIPRELKGKNKHLTDPSSINEPYCTRSVFARLKDENGITVAGVHYYSRPNGMLGASGIPDPKWLLGDNVILKV